MSLGIPERSLGYETVLVNLASYDTLIAIEEADCFE